MSDDLVARLRAAIEAKAELARRVKALDLGPLVFTTKLADGSTVEVTPNPATVLAMCDAHLKIVDLHEHQQFEFPDYYNGARLGCVICHSTYEDYAGGICDTIRALAAGYGLTTEEPR